MDRNEVAVGSEMDRTTTTTEARTRVLVIVMEQRRDK